MGGFGCGNQSSGCRKKALKLFLAVSDSALSIFIFAPLVVGYWRGVWNLMDIYLFPDNIKLSMLVSLSLGVVSGLLFCLIQEPLNNIFDHDTRPQLHLLGSRFYTFVYCICCVNHWRGVWVAWDIYTGLTWESGATSMGIGILTLAITRGLKNILAPPFLVVPDHPKGYFNVPTLFSAEKERWGYFLLDTVFTMVVTASLVVFVWRGAWVILDALLFPDDPVMSAWSSTILGMAVTILGFMFQLILIPCTRNMSKGFAKILLEDIYHTICFVGDVNVWRGVWLLLNIYFLPDLPEISNFLSSIGGIVILMCMYTANSILVRGAVMDGAGQGNKGISFPTHYLRFFYKNMKLEEEQENDVWGTDGRRPWISPPLESTKANGVCDGRGYGDGHSFTGAFNDGFNNDPGDATRGARLEGAEPPKRQTKESLKKEAVDHSETHF